MEPANMLESFPFDSSPEVQYDEWGYPRFDRAVGAEALRDAFAKFFSDGVFPSPGDAFAATKGTGLTVEVAPGACILRGAIGALRMPMSLTLDAAPTKGSACYGIMLRADFSERVRAVTLEVRKGTSGPAAAPPAPESGPDFAELRIAHVTVPTGATDLSAATLVNEKGLAVCPYAAPFERIDVSAVVEDFRRDAGAAVEDFRRDAGAAYADLAAQMERYYGLIQGAIDGTAAGHLQNQLADFVRRVETLEGRITGAADDEFARYAFEGVV